MRRQYSNKLTKLKSLNNSYNIRIIISLSSSRLCPMGYDKNTCHIIFCITRYRFRP